MVGGLVQEEHRGSREQQLAEGKAYLLTAAETLHGEREVILAEAQSRQHPDNTRPVGETACLAVGLVKGSQLIGVLQTVAV